MHGQTHAIGARMGRAGRVARGASGALAATVVAAASHTIAGGQITWLAVVATAILALPLCTALAGRVGSLWRLTVAVAVSQFIFHWAFAGLGAAQTAPASVAPDPVSPHAAHLAALQSFAPTAISAGAADGIMWAWHACAAALTILLLHRGERAVVALVHAVRTILPAVVPGALQPVAAPRRTAARARTDAPAFVSTRLASTLSLRGPPAWA